MEKHFKKKLGRFTLYTLLIVTIAVTAMIVFSPYGNREGYNYKVIHTSVVINAPLDSVFRYLGKSQNAAKWSVFVRDIQPLNADRYPDGTVGGRRRCYSREDPAMQWDELITAVQPNKRRQLVIYNLKNFSLTASGLTTEQRYEKISAAQCRLTFTVFYNRQPDFFETLKTYFAAYKIKRIFKQNLDNIKRINEGRAPEKTS